LQYKLLNKVENDSSHGDDSVGGAKQF